MNTQYIKTDFNSGKLMLRQSDIPPAFQISFASREVATVHACQGFSPRPDAAWH